MKQYDFSGWATRNNLKCSDGRTIMKDAFKENDGEIVPLVWNHRHDESFNVLGHALLENRENGVYAYCTFNDTESGKNARLLVKHGDITALSIYANQLRQQGGNVLHGAIREVSLVLAGANPGAYIDSVISHGESSDEEAIIYTGEDIVISHGSEESEKEEEEMDTTSKKAKSENEETVADVFNTLTEKQKTVVYALIGQALEDSSKSDSDETEEGGNKMKHNVFDQDEEMTGEVLSHSEMMAVISDAKRYGSMKQSALEHGITNVDYLFPEAKTITNTPDFIQRDTGWAKKVMNSVHHTPFSRIKSVLADITEDDARAKGYIKGNRKKEEVFSLLKRTTTPTTVYKKQKMDRDDVIDITDFDVVAWLKSEMRLMLDEELARAYLVGDGRTSSSDDKINEMNIRPVWTDDDLYTIKQTVSVTGGATEDDKAREFIRAAIKARKNYKGSGSPSLYINEDMLTACLLLTDTTGRDLYDSVEKLATKLRVKEIITVPVMENLKRDDASTKKSYELAGIIVNLADYNVGADNGGSVNLFDDFDIDYNAQKYLIETRCSGALTKPYSAIAIEFESTSDSASDGASE
jgi:HK97 family phage prohead protease